MYIVRSVFCNNSDFDDVTIFLRDGDGKMKAQDVFERKANIVVTTSIDVNGGIRSLLLKFDLRSLS